MEGIAYLHSQNVVHRDIKPQNLLVDKNNKLFIMDFNVSFQNEKNSIEKKKMMTKTGTVAFSAPEIFLQNEYDEKVDVWSAGTVLYMMLCGQQPFNSENISMLVHMITTSNLPQMTSELQFVSFDAFNLVEQMLTKDPSKRPTAEEVLQHPWFTEE